MDKYFHGLLIYFQHYWIYILFQRTFELQEVKKCNFDHKTRRSGHKSWDLSLHSPGVIFIITIHTPLEQAKRNHKVSVLLCQLYHGQKNVGLYAFPPVHLAVSHTHAIFTGFFNAILLTLKKIQAVKHKKIIIKSFATCKLIAFGEMCSLQGLQGLRGHFIYGIYVQLVNRINIYI